MILPGERSKRMPWWSLGVVFCVVTSGAIPAREKVPAPRPTVAEKTPRVDLYGDPLPEGAVARLGTVRWRHPNGLLRVAWCPDGKAVATGGVDKTVRIWDVSTGKEMRRFVGHEVPINSLSVSANGQLLLTSTSADGIRLWDTSTGKLSRQILPRGKTQHFNSAVLSPDGKTIAAIEKRGEAYHVTLLDSTGDELREFHKDKFRPYDLAFSPDGTLVKVVRPVGPRERKEAQVCVWRVDTGEVGFRLSLPQTPSVGAEFSPDGTIIATKAPDGPLCLWKVSTGEELRRFPCATLHGLNWLPDGKALMAAPAAKGPIKILDAVTGKELRRVEWDQDGVRVARLSPDGKTVACWGPQSFSTLSLLDIKSGKDRNDSAGHRFVFTGIAVAPNGKTIASLSADGTLRLWEPQTGKELGRLEGEGLAEARGPFYTPDGKTILVASMDGHVSGWDAVTRQRRFRTSVQPPRFLRAAALSPDGKLLVTGGWDRTVRLFDAATREEIKKWTVPEPIASLAVSPDGKTLAVGCTEVLSTEQEMESTVYLRDVKRGEETGRVKGLRGHAECLAFAPDGRTLAVAGSADRVVRLWEMTSGKERGQLAGHGDRIICAAFSPDGRVVATGGWDQTLRLFDSDSGALLGKATGDGGTPTATVFAPDGHLLVTGGGSTTALTWNWRKLVRATPPVPDSVGPEK